MPCRADIEASSLCLHGPGRVTSPCPPPEYSCYLLWGYCYVGQVVLTIGGSLISSIQTGGHHAADVFSAAALAVSVGGMDLGHGDMVRVGLRPRLRLSTAELVLREKSATDLGLGLVPTADSPDSGPQMSLLLCQCELLPKPWMAGGFSRELNTLAGSCAYVYLQIWIVETMPLRPGTSSLPMSITSLALSVHAELWARLLNFLLLCLNRRWMSSAFLWNHGLHHHRHHVINVIIFTIFIVIITIRPLFKQNFYLSLFLWLWFKFLLQS